MPLFQALTNSRNRPTVTRYLSSRNPLTVAGSASAVGPPPEFEYVRLYVPPGTSRLVQQLSVPLPPGPQLSSPRPPAAGQLVAAVVKPVHAPPEHVPAAHAQ